MGRFDKNVVIDSGVDRRELGYYSTPEFISKFMVDAMMNINSNGSFVLDPCVGKEELIKGFYQHNIEIDGIDIYEHGDTYYCNFIKKDFIEFYKENRANLMLDQKINLKYDYYIANPPYNCHEVDYIRNNKAELNRLFPKVGVHNMYSMFISAIVDSAKEGALISFICADGFLTARMHKYLREQILKDCSIHYLLLCPTDLFWDQKADVRTSILILQKGKQFQQKIKTLDRPNNKLDLLEKLENQEFNERELDDIVNTSSDSDYEFLVEVPAEIQSLFKNKRVGEKFKCITGISTGSDSLYLSKERKNGFEIPFYKNPGTRKFYAEEDGYLTNEYLKLDKDIKNFMVRNKSFMLQEGITCSSMGLPFGACYMPAGSTFGVNANIFCDKEDIWWLISYLNSSLITYVVRGVLNRSNMITSGYVSKIPVIELSSELKSKLGVIAFNAYSSKVQPKELAPIIQKIDNIIFDELAFSDDVKNQILQFAGNLQKRV